MRKSTQIMLATAVVLAVSGCSNTRNRVGELPPVDESAYGNGSGTGSGSVGNTIVPGSQADFQRSVSSDTIFFETDSYAIDQTDRATLTSQSQWLQRYPNTRVTIEGHADERGTREYNLALGERRANAARNYLVSLGIDPSRISVVSYGKERPIALGSDAESWARNRRAVSVTVQGY